MATTPIDLQVPDPQTIMRQLWAQRQQVMVAGSLQQQRNQNVETALDAIFGNPEVVRVKKLKDAVVQAGQNVPAVEGEDDLSRELRVMRAQRDAVADLSPDLASQINTRMLQVAQLQLERRKLVADTKRTEGQETRDEAQFPLDMATKEVELAQKAEEGINYMNPRTGEMKNVTALDSIERRRLRLAGWVEAGKPQLQGSKDDITGLTKPVQSDLQTALLTAQNQLDNIGAIAEKYDPRFTEYLPQLGVSLSGTIEKLGAGRVLSVEQKAFKEKYTEWRRNSIDAFNAYIKSITGAAMAVSEAERIQKAFPDAEKDSHTEYVSKLRGVAKQILGIRKRAEQALKTGLQLTGDQWLTVATPPVTDSDVDAFLQQYTGLGARAAAPGARKTKGGVTYSVDE